MKRRDFLKLMGLASGAALDASCDSNNKIERIIPYLVPPADDIIPGEAHYYPSTCMECPAQCGMLVTVKDDYPIKLEGLFEHPIAETLCIRGQASLTRLYSANRIRNPLIKVNGEFKAISWEEAYTKVRESFKPANGKHVFLSGRITGTLSHLIDFFCVKTGVERLPEFELYNHASLKEAYRILFNRRTIPSYRIADADFLLTFGADIIETFINPVYFAEQLSLARQAEDFKWYHLEPHASLTGLNANKRIPISPGSEFYILMFLLKELARNDMVENNIPAEALRALPEISEELLTERTQVSIKVLHEIANHLASAKNPLLIIGGVSTAHKYGLESALLAGLIQYALGMHERTMSFTNDENYSSVGTFLDIQKLSTLLKYKEIETILIAETNPVRNAPQSILLKENLKKAGMRIGLSDFMNETMRACDIIFPVSHPLESWGDAEPRTGFKSIIQPVLQPIFNARSIGDILLQIMNAQPDRYQLYLYQQWTQKYGSAFVKEFLSKGIHQESIPEAKIELQSDPAILLLKEINLEYKNSEPVVIITPSLRSYDGRSRTLPLLQEIPEPMTAISYGEWISVSQPYAEGNQLSDGDEIAVSATQGLFKLPVKIQPLLPNNIFMIQRDMLNSAYEGVEMRTGEAICYLDKATISKTGAHQKLCKLSGSYSQHGRGIARFNNINTLHEPVQHLYTRPPYKEYRWAMVIDLNLCTGCSACVAACYIENNIPLVGRKNHLEHREMSWIRIEPFYENERFIFEPMLCQQCDYAPCESVCPVNAAYHNPEGLNVQVYNRCVGTRYCSNNCPYKVRRFNWFEYVRQEPENKMRNPDVFVRTKGIMEKCMFCVQRIRAAHDKAKDESRKIHDGEVIPACAQTCPSSAITFGNLLDTRSEVYQLSKSPRAYRIFEELGFGPAVYYLARKA